MDNIEFNPKLTSYTIYNHNHQSIKKISLIVTPIQLTYCS